MKTESHNQINKVLTTPTRSTWAASVTSWSVMLWTELRGWKERRTKLYQGSFDVVLLMFLFPLGLRFYLNDCILLERNRSWQRRRCRNRKSQNTRDFFNKLGMQISGLIIVSLFRRWGEQKECANQPNVSKPKSVAGYPFGSCLMIIILNYGLISTEKLDHLHFWRGKVYSQKWLRQQHKQHLSWFRVFNEFKMIVEK